MLSVIVVQKLQVTKSKFMIFLILLVALSILIAVFLILKDEWPTIFFAVPLTLLIGIPCVVAICSFIGLFPEQYAEVRTVEKLVAFQDNSNISGDFFLGIGSIDGAPAYHYIYKLENGGYKEKSIKTSDITVFQDNSEPRIIMYESKFKNDIWLWFAIPVGTFGAEIHAPQNSIINEYRVDAK